jgi:type II secretory pathway pseudopilin PulG
MLNLKNKKSGITLVEVMVSMSILVMISLIVFVFQNDIYTFTSIFSETLTIQNKSVKTLKTITSEVRNLSYSSLGSYPIVEAEENSFVFYSDVDGDQLKERVRYFLDGDVLKKGVIKPTGIPLVYNSGDEVVIELLDNIVNGVIPIFQYYDDSYSGVGSSLEHPIQISSVRLLKMNLVIDYDVNNPPGAFSLTTQISMRNLKDNL